MSRRSKRLAGLAVLAVALILAVGLSIAIGARPTSLGDVFTTLHSPGKAPGDLGTIVWDLRVPRTLLGICAGAALGMAGALTQGYTRNPLADPGMLGVTAGAAFAVVVSIYLFDLVGIDKYVWFALLGAALGAMAVLGVSSVGGGKVNPLTLILAGAALSAFLHAGTTAMALIDQRSLDRMRFWTAGSLAGRDLSILSSVVPFLAVGAVLALIAAPSLNLLGLGDDVASGLGVNVTLQRILGFSAVTLLAGGATAATGSIAFIGLVVPHIVRAVTGPDQRWVIPYSALLGAVLLLVSDVVGRVVARPGELQVGIVFAAVGAPFFILLVRRRRMVTL